MTSGAAIAHAERTPARNCGRPCCRIATARCPRWFQHVERVPIDEQRVGIVQVFAGSLNTLRSPTTHHSEIFGGDVQAKTKPRQEPRHLIDRHLVPRCNLTRSVEGQPVIDRSLLCVSEALSLLRGTSNDARRPTFLARRRRRSKNELIKHKINRTASTIPPNLKPRLTAGAIGAGGLRREWRDGGARSGRKRLKRHGPAPHAPGHREEPPIGVRGLSCRNDSRRESTGC
jgi:hypothetical protein